MTDIDVSSELGAFLKKIIDALKGGEKVTWVDAGRLLSRFIRAAVLYASGLDGMTGPQRKAKVLEWVNFAIAAMIPKLGWAGVALRVLMATPLLSSAIASLIDGWIEGNYEDMIMKETV